MQRLSFGNLEIVSGTHLRVSELGIWDSSAFSFTASQETCKRQIPRIGHVRTSAQVEVKKERDDAGQGTRSRNATIVRHSRGTARQGGFLCAAKRP